MAIIRLDCNLNGGDSVTPNNELFYRIYGDVDAYTVPIHTTGTALSDANVTVDNDNVIITGVDGTTNTEFKIAAVDASFNEGVLSDAAAGSTILFEDDFTGSIDPFITNDKWTVTNGFPADFNFVQDDQLDMSVSNTGSAPTLGEVNIISKVGADVTNGTKVFTWTNYWTGLNATTPNLALGINKTNASRDDIIQFTKSTTSTYIKCDVKEGGVTIGSIEMNTEQTVSATTYKVVFKDGDPSMYYWYNSQWNLMLTQSGMGATGDYYFYATIKDNGVSLLTIDDCAITNADFSTQYPE